MSKDIKPPQWAKLLLRKFAHPDSVEEVEGDLDEFFSLWKTVHGEKKAKWKYIQTVITLLRPFSKRTQSHDVHSPTTAFFMIDNYFKISWRTILKNRVSSLINISGLTIGLSTSIIIMLVVINEFKYDQFHSNLDDIYVLMKNQKTNDGISTGQTTAGPMAEALRTEFPEVRYAARMTYFQNEHVVVNDKISYESGVYADPDFFNIMQFSAASGDIVRSLQSNSSLVITSEMAKKLFGEENPIGKTIQFNRHHSLVVGAVMNDIPPQSSVKFGMVIPFALFEKENEWLTKWDDNRISTWVRLQPTVQPATLNIKMTDLLQQRSNDKTVSQFLYPLKDLYLHGSFSNGHPNGGRITAVQILIGFGAFVLLIACINFMNLATAQSEHRAKEVGIRKVLGASRRWIIVQFLNESFVITLLSLICATSFVYLIIPSFNTITHSGIQLDLASAQIWLGVIGIAFVTSLLAGSYPSLFLSRFLPARVLKGRVATTKGIGLRRVLVTFQFSISVLCLIGTIIMYSQFEHVRNRPIGYEQENLVDIQLDSVLTAKFPYLKAEILKIANVRTVSGESGNILYSGASITGMDWPGKRPGEELSVAVADVEYDWSKTFGFKLVSGRDFDPAIASDASACLINESAASQMGLNNPVGSVVGGHAVIGVFQNFVYNNPFGAIAPMAVYLNPHVDHLYLRVQNNSQWRETLARIETLTKSISPEFPFHFTFTKDEYQNHFNEIVDTSLMISIFGGLTIFISCLGLFGLAGFVAEKRSKEMSIRKVFGATSLRILISLSQDFLRPVVYSILLVIPLSVLIAQKVLSNISYRVPLRWWMFTSAGILTLMISMVIVLYHGWRTSQENPVVRLRNE